MRSASLHRQVLRYVAHDPSEVRVLSPQTLGPTDVRQGSVAFHADLDQMRWWCRVNERHVLSAGLTDVRILAGFQRLSRAWGVAARYQRLAASAREVTLFGIADDDPTRGGQHRFEVRDLTGHQLAKEWFLLIDSPGYRSLLVAREVDIVAPGAPRTARQFEGITSHCQDVIAYAAGLLDDLPFADLDRLAS